MNWRRNEWTLYVIVLVLTVAALVGGQLLWHKLTIAKPLDITLQQIQGVESVNWGRCI